MNKKAIRAAANEELLQRFKEVAMIHRELRTAKEANRAFDEGVVIWGEFKQRGREAVNSFLSLLHSDDPAVRMNSAGLALLEAPDQAVPVLELLTKEPRSVGVAATMTLREWRAGRLKPLI